MAEVDVLAAFVTKAGFGSLPNAVIQAVKIRVLDSIAVALPAIHSEVIAGIRRFVEQTGGTSKSRLIGGGTSSPSYAALYNCSLIRYLDFNDSMLTKGETFHPSDVIGGCLTFADHMDSSGEILLTAIALSYQIQTTLSEVAPVRAKGFDHVVQLGYSAAAALSKILGLSEEKMAHGIAISGTTNNPLRVTRTGALSHWKGLAAPYTVFNAANSVLLAREGITGPKAVFEGNKGFKETISGPFDVEWDTVGLSAVTRSILKKYNSEIHSQSTLEGILDLKEQYGFSPSDIELVRVEIFDVAFNIIGGGEEGEKYIVRTKEEADHSLPYLIAVALLDNEITPHQYEPQRIIAPDVQDLLRKVTVTTSPDLSDRFPDEMPVRIQVTLKNGKSIETDKRDYDGFTTRPMTMTSVAQKFERLSRTTLSAAKRARIIDLVNQLERVAVRDLMEELLL